jgi:hypothetical protein
VQSFISVFHVYFVSIDSSLMWICKIILYHIHDMVYHVYLLVYVQMPHKDYIFRQLLMSEMALIIGVDVSFDNTKKQYWR